MKRLCLITILLPLLTACWDNEKSTAVDVEINVKPALSASPFIGKDLAFYRADAAAYKTMREWCKARTEAVRSDAESKECKVVNHVHATGGPQG